MCVDVHYGALLKPENAYQQPEIHSGGRTDPPECELLAGCTWTGCFSEARHWCICCVFHLVWIPIYSERQHGKSGLSLQASPALSLRVWQQHLRRVRCFLFWITALWSSDDLLGPEQSFSMWAHWLGESPGGAKNRRLPMILQPMPATYYPWRSLRPSAYSCPVHSWNILQDCGWDSAICRTV